MYAPRKPKQKEPTARPAQRKTSRTAAGRLAALEEAANQGPGVRETLRLQQMINGRGVVQGVFDKGQFRDALEKRQRKAALEILEGATYDELGHFMIQVAVNKEIHQEDLAYLYEEASSPIAKLGAWQALAYRRGNEGVDLALAKKSVPKEKEDTIRGGIYEDVSSGAEYLQQEIDRIQKGSGLIKNIRSRWAVEEFDKIFQQARNLELQHGVSIRASKPSHLREPGSEYQTFRSDEIGILDSVLSRLPRGHIADNPQLEFFQRQPRHPSFKLRGAEYSRGERRVNVFDDTFTGPYRATGETSYLGAHDKDHRLTPGEEALTHEIGHSVDALLPGAATAFSQAAGWERFAGNAEVKEALMIAGAEEGEAQDRIQILNEDRALETRRRVFHGGFEYMVDPDDGNKAGFYRRRLNRMPGDDKTLESGFSHIDYARTSPKEHFAEMYAHMIHVPERTFRDYVHDPEQRESAAHVRYLDLLEAAKLDDSQVEGRDRAKLEYDEALEQRKALGSQWDIMREHVFGVTGDVVNQEVLKLRKAASENGIDPELAEGHLRARAREAATPAQVHRLGVSIFRELLAKKK
ncbi:MAG TPA: hypothetical protein VF789_15695 [Thermoanaerobaculia bacterium]